MGEYDGMSEYAKLCAKEKKLEMVEEALKVERDLTASLQRCLDVAQKCLEFYANQDNYNEDGVLLMRGRIPNTPDGPGECWEEPEFGLYAKQVIETFLENDPDI